MKKLISVFLAALMLMACVSVSGLAVEGDEICNCPAGEHVSTGLCDCCVYCPNPDKTAWNTCYRDNGSFCCGKCDGIMPCGCDCSCCNVNADIDGDKNNTSDYITDQDKEEIVSGFQAILKKVSDFFDMIFDAIFEFLRIDEVLGKGDDPTA